MRQTNWLPRTCFTSRSSRSSLTRMVRPPSSVPLRELMAASASSGVSNSTMPQPLDRPVCAGVRGVREPTHKRQTPGRRPAVRPGAAELLPLFATAVCSAVWSCMLTRLILDHVGVDDSAALAEPAGVECMGKQNMNKP